MIAATLSILLAGAILVAALLFLIGVTLVRLAATRPLMLIRVLAVAVGQNLPLPQTLRQAAGSERGKIGVLLLRLAERIEVGDPICVALQTAYPQCPGRYLGALRAAEAAGTLPTILRELAAEPGEPLDSHPGVGASTYFFVMLTAFGLSFFYLGHVLVPKFSDILGDFGVELPALTASAMTFTQPVYLGAFLLLVGVIALVYAQASLAARMIPRRADLPSRTTRVLDAIAWRLPLLRQIVEARAWARQLPLIQAAVRAGVDIAVAARHAALADANQAARQRLRRFADQVERGAPPAEAARRAGFPDTIRLALRDSSERSLAGGLAYLAAYYRSLQTHWEHVATRLALPLITICWAGLALYFVLCVLLPMKTVVDGLVEEAF